MREKKTRRTAAEPPRALGGEAAGNAGPAEAQSLPAAGAERGAGGQTAQTAQTPQTPLPEEFLARMRSLLPEEEYQAFLSSYGRKRLFSLRVNPLKCSRDHFLELTGADAGLRPVPWEPDGFYYPEELRPGRHPRHEAGMYYIQEASAMVPAVLCGARPGERVLDLCAAPGGKSTKLAADLRGRGLLAANEIHPERARILSSNLERMGVRNALVTSAAPDALASRFPLYFDRVVVDAPCSGEGMFRKEEEAVRHWSVGNVRMCADRQRQILEEAAAMLRPGGTLVYSTCTFSPEENEGTIARFLEAHPEFSIVDLRATPGIEADRWGFAPGVPGWAGTDRFPGAASLAGTVRLWPHRLEGEGHFAAVLQKEGGGTQAACSAEDHGRETHGKTDSEGKKTREKRPGRGRSRGKKGAGPERGAQEPVRLWKAFCEEALTPPADFGRDAALDLEDGLSSCVSTDVDAAPLLPIPDENLYCFGDTLYALPVPAASLSLDGLRVLRAGLQLGTVTKGRFIPSHALGMALRVGEVRGSVDLDGRSDAALAWFRGETITLPNMPLARAASARRKPGTDFSDAITGAWDARGTSTGVNNTASAVFFTLPDYAARQSGAVRARGRMQGWVLVTVDGCAAGWGKVSGAVLKNHYPKGLRKILS